MTQQGTQQPGIEQLSPYISLVLYDAGSKWKDITAECSTVLVAYLKSAKRGMGGAGASDAGSVCAPAAGSRRYGRLVLKYSLWTLTEPRVPGWLRVVDGKATSELRDTIHHIVVVLQLGKTVGIHCSDPRVKKTLQASSFATLTPCHRDDLWAAFGRGAAKAMWLSSVRPSVRERADSKVLLGPGLEDALDPLGDATFRASAARCQHDQQTVGLNGDSSTVWMHAAPAFDDFVLKCGDLMAAVGKTSGTIPDWYRTLSNPGELEPTSVPYALSVTDPDVLDSNSTAPSHDDGRWYRMEYSIKKGGTAGSFEVQACSTEPSEKHSATMAIVPAGKAKAFKYKLRAIGTTRESPPSPLAAFLLRSPTVRVYLEDDGVFEGGVVAAPPPNVTPFGAWLFPKIPPACQAREKPASPWNRTNPPKGDSLFAWLFNHYPSELKRGTHGIVLCGDGAGEIADFIVLGLQGDEVSVDLVHVKSGSTESGRQLAAAVFDVVTSQVVRNIKYVNRDLLAGELKVLVASKSPVASKTFGPRSSSAQLIKSLKSARPDKIRWRFVIVQPHIMQALNPGAEAKTARARQMHTILNSTLARCRQAGAELVVVGTRT